VAIWDAGFTFPSGGRLLAESVSVCRFQIGIVISTTFGGFMDWLRGTVAALVVASLVPACSSGTPEPGPADEGRLGTVAQAITTACSFNTIGLPCDPDGPAGPKLECEGVCSVAFTGYVNCQVVATGALNGVVCGTSAGVGDAACKKYCSGKTCLAGNAPAGAACRPTPDSNPCEGQCNPSGACKAVASPCTYGRQDQLCKFDTCNFANATTCLTKNLARNTRCSDADACSISTCNTVGVCSAGGVKGCDDGNPCTTDACDPVDGGCVGTNDDANTCSDGNACTAGDYCSAGGCVAGTTEVDCDDNNACTADSCDPNTGCAHVSKSCSDGNACTDDVCAPADGSCTHPDKVCDDNDPCTTNSCNTGSGCVFTPLNCDDGDACTADACSAGQCLNNPVDCADNDDCTADSCDKVTGCAHAVIAGCGAGGTGGTAGAAGTAGSGGTTGGTDVGGIAGEGGVAGTSAGGTATDGGEPATAGTATGGTAGANNTSAGSSNAGTTSAGNTSSNGGNATAGNNVGAEPGTDGGAADGGTTGITKVVQDNGCSCRTAGGPKGSSPLGLVLVAFGWLALGRRRRAA